MPPSAPKGPRVVPGRFIAVIKQDVVSTMSVSATAESVASAIGVSLRKTFSAAPGKGVRGFSFQISDGLDEQEVLASVRRRPDVAYVAPVRIVRKLGVPVPLLPGQQVAPGVQRVGSVNATTAAPAANVAVAVLDTGAALDHPDLNVVSGKNCIYSGQLSNDDEGHGTHCAGIIGWCCSTSPATLLLLASRDGGMQNAILWLLNARDPLQALRTTTTASWGRHQAPGS